MKKTYIAPQAEVIKMVCAPLLTLSGGNGLQGLSGGGGYGGEDNGDLDPE